MAFYLEINSPRNKRTTSHHPYESSSPMAHSVFSSSHVQQDFAYRSNFSAMPSTDNQLSGMEGYMDWMTCRGDTFHEEDTSWENNDYHRAQRISSSKPKSEYNQTQPNGILRPPRHQRERSLGRNVTWRDDIERTRSSLCVSHPCFGKSALIDVHGESSSCCTARSSIPSRTAAPAQDPILSFRSGKIPDHVRRVQNKQSSFHFKRSPSPLHTANEGLTSVHPYPISIRRAPSPHPTKIPSENSEMYDNTGMHTDSWHGIAKNPTIPPRVMITKDPITKSRNPQHYSPSPKRDARNPLSVPEKITIRAESPFRQGLQAKPHIENHLSRSSTNRNTPLNATTNRAKVNNPMGRERSIDEERSYIDISRDIGSPSSKLPSLKNVSHAGLPKKERHYAEIVWKSKEPKNETPLEEKKRGWNPLRRSGSVNPQRPRTESPHVRRKSPVNNEDWIVPHDDDKDWY